MSAPPAAESRCGFCRRQGARHRARRHHRYRPHPGGGGQDRRWEPPGATADRACASWGCPRSRIPEPGPGPPTTGSTTGAWRAPQTMADPARAVLLAHVPVHHPLPGLQRDPQPPIVGAADRPELATRDLPTGSACGTRPSPGPAAGPAQACAPPARRPSLAALGERCQGRDQRVGVGGSWQSGGSGGPTRVPVWWVRVATACGRQRSPRRPALRVRVRPIVGPGPDCTGLCGRTGTTVAHARRWCRS
jgi:hypothetical protein